MLGRVGDDRTIIHLQQCRPMIRIVGVHRIDHTDIVDVFRDQRQQLTDGQTAFAIPSKSKGGWQQAACRTFRQ